MPCTDAIVRDVLTGHPGQTVEELVSILEEKDIRTLPIVDDNNKLVGLFGFYHLMKALLPVAATMEDGLQRLDFVIGAEPGIAKRLRKLYPQKVEDVMERDCRVVHPHTSAWEAIRLLVKYGSPIPVIEEKDGTLIGIITKQSALANLKNVLKDVEADEEARGKTE